MKSYGCKSSNVRGVGTFFDTCFNLGQHSSYNFKNLCGHFPESSMEKFSPFWYCMELWNQCEISILVGLLKSENIDFEENCFPPAHKYSTTVYTI